MKENEQKVTKEAKKGKKEGADLPFQLLLVVRQGAETVQTPRG